ncbi:MBL fold metallo-hydrolase RNA specificity domain-containing protein [Azospirillum picis]|uniref:Metallo-beta-lactamase family protein n=1 Tax=Azospirillum picis TaxID=488438 RepID=A0ABU0MCX7_9PROT|nr:MBL fold metallo-hydrolase [Azospirillum picis]MBP2297718.1 metallo-beta-lactamase family protein [Azospirillum picis]MDQ0531259.1 metallo-beta-lactamase family protein [Azospirillum picis]
MSLSLTFHGAAGTVTGSCFRLSTPEGDVLVDCGMFQGTKTIRELNYRPFPFDPASIRAVLLTHAHIDHSGLLPKLSRLGFRGRIHATGGTVDLLDYMLPDSGYIQEGEVERLNRRNRQRGRAAVQAIYTQDDAIRCLRLLRPVEYRRWTTIIPGMRARFWPAGHILGSASIEVEAGGGAAGGAGPTRILFSGDLGPGGKSFHADASGPETPDWMVLETTYGDRERTDLDESGRQAVLRAEVAAALAGGGVLVIPVFAVERTQELLYDLDRLFEGGLMPPVDIFLDSPLADAVTGVFRRHLADLETDGDPFGRANLHHCRSVAESQRLNSLAGGAIIMAASGMCDAGRVRHHLKNRLWRPQDTVLLVGYQAPGTLGRLLREGAKRVRIHGEEIEVRARVRSVDVYSGHADRSALLAWLEARHGVGHGLFLVHGEEEARAAIRTALLERGWPAERIALPGLDDRLDLAAPRPALPAERHPRLAPAAMAAATAGRDWHNRYAEALLALRRTLDGAPDDTARERILAGVMGALDGAPVEGPRP